MPFHWEAKMSLPRAVLVHEHESLWALEEKPSRKSELFLQQLFFSLKRVPWPVKWLILAQTKKLYL